MNSFSENQSKIQSLVETLPNNRGLSSSVWSILRDAPSEQQGALLEFYETLVRANTKRTHKTKPSSSDQSLFTPLLGDSFIRLRLHLNCSPDTFYQDACQWLMRQSSFADQVQLLHFRANDPRLPYFQFNPKLRQGMSDEHFSLIRTTPIDLRSRAPPDLHLAQEVPEEFGERNKHPRQAKAVQQPLSIDLHPARPAVLVTHIWH